MVARLGRQLSEMDCQIKDEADLINSDLAR
jgi:hypothetical protein